LLWLGVIRVCPIDRYVIKDRSIRCYRWTDGPECGWLLTYLLNRLTDGPTVYSRAVRPMVLQFIHEPFDRWSFVDATRFAGRTD